MAKSRRQGRFALSFALAGALLLSNGCSGGKKLPEYKAYDQPKKVILHGDLFGKNETVVVHHLEDFIGEHRGHGRFLGDSVGTILGEAKDKDRTFYRLNVYGEELWTDEHKDFYEINDENVVAFIARNPLERIPAELRDYARERKDDSMFQLEVRKLSESMKDRKIALNLTKITGRNYIRLISNHLVKRFNRMGHGEHPKNYEQLVWIDTKNAISALVSDIYRHRKMKGGMDYASMISIHFRDMKRPSPIENVYVMIATDNNELCQIRQHAINWVPPSRRELKRENTYTCGKCYKGCTTIDDPDDIWASREKRYGVKIPWLSARQIAPCKESGYPCLCLKERVMFNERASKYSGR